MATKVKEKPLKATRDWDGNPVDLTHLIGYTEMSVKEIHYSEVDGPVNKDKGFVFVMQDEVGNNRVARISHRQLRETFRNINWDITDY